MRLYGKEGLQKRLTDIAVKDRLPHAILLHGNSGDVTKREADHNENI